MSLHNRTIQFNLFKNRTSRRLKELGDVAFAIELLEQDSIRKYFRCEAYLECFYLLGMLDYICHIHDIPLSSNYDDIRSMKR